MAVVKLNDDKPDAKNPSFPTNSNSTKHDYRSDREKTKKIVTGKAVKKKKSIGDKIADTFVDEDAGNVKDYLIFDVFIPALKNTISELITTGVNMLMFGETNGKSGGYNRNNIIRDRDRSYTSYNRYYDQNRPSAIVARQGRYHFDNILIDNRSDAEDVMAAMVERVDLYGVATVADLYGYIGMTCNYTDYSYGWENLNMGCVRRVRDGYLLDLPRPIPVD